MKAKNVEKMIYAQEIQKARLGNETVDRMGLIMTMVLYDKFGFSLKKIENCNARVMDISHELVNKDNKTITVDSLIVYAESKKCDVRGWMKSIPMRHKLVLGGAGKFKTIPGCEKYIESSMLSVILITIPVLKETYRFSKKMMDELLYWVAYYIDSYATGYVTDKVITESFVEDEEFDIVKWKPLKG